MSSRAHRQLVTQQAIYEGGDLPISNSLTPLVLFDFVSGFLETATDTYGAIGLNGSSKRAHIANQAKYQAGANSASWTFFGKIYIEAAGQGTDRRFLDKVTGGADYLWRVTTANQLSFTLGGTVSNSITTSSIVADGWYTIFAVHNHVAKTLQLFFYLGKSVTSSTAADTTALSYTPNTGNLSFGATQAGAQWMNGRMAGFGKADAVLTSDQMLEIHNGGHDFLLSNASAGLASVISWYYPFRSDVGTGLLVEQVGGVDTLTNVGSVAEIGGPQGKEADADGDAINYLGNHGTEADLWASAATLSVMPTLRRRKGRWYVELDGSADFFNLGTDSDLAYTGDFYLYWVQYSPNLAATGSLPSINRHNNTTEGYTTRNAAGNVTFLERNLTPVTWIGGTAALTDSQDHICGIIRRGNKYYFRHNGQIVAVGKAGTLNATAGIAANLGARGNGNTLYRGWIGYSLSEAGTLTDAMAAQLEETLGRMFNVPVTPARITPATGLVGAGGQDKAFTTVTGSISSSGETFVAGGNRYQARTVRVDRVWFWAATVPDGLGWRLKQLRRTAANTYDVIAETGLFVPTSLGLNVYDLKSPWTIRGGFDYLGIYAPNGAAVGYLTTTGVPTLSASGDVTGAAVSFASDTSNATILHWMEQSDNPQLRPNLGCCGDSIITGHNLGVNGTGNGFYSHWETTFSDDRSAAPLYYLEDTLDTRYRTVNYAQGGKTLSDVISTQLPALIADNPNLGSVVVHCGTNDIGISGRTWTEVGPLWDQVYALIPDGWLLYITDILPDSNKDATQSAEIRNINTQLDTWVLDKPKARRIHMYSDFQDPNSTDDMLASLTKDGLHLGYPGVQLFAQKVHSVVRYNLFAATGG